MLEVRPHGPHEIGVDFYVVRQRRGVGGPARFRRLYLIWLQRLVWTACHEAGSPFARGKLATAIPFRPHPTSIAGLERVPAGAWGLRGRREFRVARPCPCHS